MADRYEVMTLRHEQRIQDLESKLRELTEGGPSDEWGSKQRPSNGLFLRDRSVRGKVYRISVDSTTVPPSIKLEEV